MKTAVALRHVHFEDLGTLEPLLRQRGFEVHYLDPAVDDVSSTDARLLDLVIVLGGPIGANDDGRHPFLLPELRLIEQRLASNRPLLGICLGAQLIARVLGSRVDPMGEAEIGFAPTSLTTAGVTSPLSHLAEVSVLHWHADRFELPQGAQLLASTAQCAEQAFALGDAVLGLQFHLEVDATYIESWLVGHHVELVRAGVDPRLLRDDAHLHGDALREASRRFAQDWLDRVTE